MREVDIAFLKSEAGDLWGGLPLWLRLKILEVETVPLGFLAGSAGLDGLDAFDSFLVGLVGD